MEFGEPHRVACHLRYEGYADGRVGAQATLELADAVSRAFRDDPAPRDRRYKAAVTSTGGIAAIHTSPMFADARMPLTIGEPGSSTYASIRALLSTNHAATIATRGSSGQTRARRRVLPAQRPGCVQRVSRAGARRDEARIEQSALKGVG